MEYLTFRWRFLLLTLLYSGLSTIIAQNKNNINYQEKFVNARGIKLHYLDFGGSGTALIFIQSYHQDASEWINWRGYDDFASQFTSTNHVYAVTRRGYGKSSNTGWGYDVATQSEDLIAFMDAIEIDKAILVGRSPAYQDIIWIAEHHPDRLAGMVFIDPPSIIPDITNPEMQELIENLMSLACDLGEKNKLIGMSRAS